MLFVITSDEKEKKVVFEHAKTASVVLTKNGERRTVHQPVSTTCNIMDSVSGELVGTGTANCNPTDRFEYKRGRKLALKRAMENAGFGTADRTAVWEKYLG